MKRKLCLRLCALLLFVLPGIANAQIQVINRFAGTGTAGYSGDGGAATAATFNGSTGVAVDAVGNVYVADINNNVVRKINTSGIISTIAGNGTAGYSGDGAAATAAQLSDPIGVAVDATGNVYIGDYGNNVVRMVNTLGVITTIAGNGTPGFSGDGSAATSAQLNQPYGVMVDATGNIYIADYGNSVIRKVNTLGVISTVAGVGTVTGYSGDNGAATAATLGQPTDIAMDATGNLYIADNGNHVVREVNTLGVITTFAGNGIAGYSGDGGLATAAKMNNPYGIATDAAGNVYVTDPNSSVVRKINTSGVISTFAGSGSFGSSGDGGDATAALLAGPTDVVVSGNKTYIADLNGNEIRILTPDNPPAFTNGAPQTLTLCQDADTLDMNARLAISDADAGETETWNAALAPTHGTLGGFPYSSVSNGGMVTPTGLYYVPDAGYSGADSFKITISDGVAVTRLNVYVTINPTPVAGIPSDQSVCNGAATTAVTFNSTVSGTTYSWTNNNTSIGLGGSGTGNIGSFTATNALSSPATATIIVTPTANTCAGSPQSFTITVKPTPAIVGLIDQAVCNGAATVPVNFSGTVSSMEYNWTNNNTTVGLAASGSGDIGSFTATNISSVPSNATVMVTPVASGCTGTTESFIISVNPTPVVFSPANQTLCNGTATAEVDFNGTVSGTAYNWTNDHISINLAASGSGDIGSFTAVNATSFPVVATIAVTPSANSCTGATQSFTIRVDPTPDVVTIAGQTVCNGTATAAVNFTGSVSGTTYNWTNNHTTIGLAVSGSGDIGSFTATNTTTDPDTATIMVTPSAGGCTGATGNFTIIVNPTPMLSSTQTPLPICSNTTFLYTSTSATTGTTFTWSRATVTNISNGPGSGTTGDIAETLINTIQAPVAVVYIDTLRANGCMNTQAITVTVNPTPLLSSTLSAPGICDSTLFSYNPTSDITGAAYNWTRLYVPGIDLIAATGPGNPNEFLDNTTYFNVTVTYVYTVTANGCSNSQNVTVVVHPTPKLSTALTDTACSGAAYAYSPDSYTPGTTYAWARASVTGITPATGTGTGAINEVLTNSTTTAQNVSYTYVMTANGCQYSQHLSVRVNPNISSPSISIMPPSSVCLNTMYQNFGAATSPAAGTFYAWYAVNATVWAESDDRQNALVNFDHSGTAEIILTTYISGTSCGSRDTFNVTVGTTSADAPPDVIYFNNQFICLQNIEDAYQWGYDDSTTLDSTIITGQINQNYYNNNPDLINRHYWVMVTHNGCTQKAYYNAPIGGNILPEQRVVKVYPNPANDQVNVELPVAPKNTMRAEVVNMMGQTVRDVTTADSKAGINIAGLPAGMYIINCYSDAVKVATTRFIKN